MEAVGELTSGIAHDFNNILSAMIGALEPLAELVAENDDAARYVRMSMRAALTASDLVKRLLAFSRRRPAHPEPLVSG